MVVELGGKNLSEENGQEKLLEIIFKFVTLPLGRNRHDHVHYSFVRNIPIKVIKTKLYFNFTTILHLFCSTLFALALSNFHTLLTYQIKKP